MSYCLYLYAIYAHASFPHPVTKATTSIRKTTKQHITSTTVVWALSQSDLHKPKPKRIQALHERHGINTETSEQTAPPPDPALTTTSIPKINPKKPSRKNKVLTYNTVQARSAPAKINSNQQSKKSRTALETSYRSTTCAPTDCSQINKKTETRV